MTGGDQKLVDGPSVCEAIGCRSDSCAGFSICSHGMTGSYIIDIYPVPIDGQGGKAILMFGGGGIGREN